MLTRKSSCLNSVQLLELFVVFPGLPMGRRLLIMDRVVFTEGSALSGKHSRQLVPVLRSDEDLGASDCDLSIR